MNIMINQEDLASSLARWMLRKKLHQQRPFKWSGVDQYVAECRAEYRRSQHIVIDFNHVNKLINKEINQYKQEVSEDYKSNVKDLAKFLIEKDFAKIFPTKFLIDTHLRDPRQTLTKSVGPQLDNQIRWITDLSQANTDQPYLIRNVANNELLLQMCIKNRLPFWFLDTGYTNFLHHKNKIWHRLVRNNTHHGTVSIDYPEDRLHLFPELPTKWRRKGNTVLVVESSENHYRMLGTTLADWRQRVENELKKHTDRPIEFRAKPISRKNRQSVYDLLMNTKEYYCVVSDSSAAVVESIWAGVPAISLRRHISNSVTRHNLNMIETPYRGDLHKWLCAVSYNQFTFEELCNGTALHIMRTHGTI